ncbi:MAG: DMT family transporter [Acidobacteriota bacterium]
MVPSPTVGMAACLAAALAWAVAVGWFRRPIATWGPWTVNLAKCTMAMVLLAVTVWAVGQGPVLLAAPPVAVGWIALSGLLGMTLGDTALFAAVPLLGAYRTLLWQTVNPLFTALWAGWLFGERWTLHQGIGGATVLVGITLVVSTRAPHARTGGGSRPLPAVAGAAVAGTALALLAAFGQGTGVALAKVGMESVPFLSAALVRLATAVLGLLAVLAVRGKLLASLRTLVSPTAWKELAAPSFLGTYLAILLMMAGIAGSPAALAAVLLSTSPVFSLLLEAREQRVVPSPRAIAGTLLAIGGVGWMSWGG